MRSRKRLLKNSRLYLVLDAQVCGYSKLFCIAQQAVKAQIDVIQLRDKKGLLEDILHFSKRLVKLVEGTKTLFILNDRVDLAWAVGADGVHLGQEDLLLKDARKILGTSALIGISCQNLEHALQAQQEGADYIGFGSVFKTLTKPDRQPMNLNLLKKAAEKIKIPVFPIGGITLDNTQRLTELGVKRVAVCRAVCEAADVAGAVRKFKEILTQGGLPLITLPLYLHAGVVQW